MFDGTNRIGHTNHCFVIGAFVAITGEHEIDSGGVIVLIIVLVLVLVPIRD